MTTIRRLRTWAVLVAVYTATLATAVFWGIFPRRRWKPTGRIMVTGTFHNPNWYISHLSPLARSGVKEVLLVVDDPQLPLEKVTCICPPKWLARIISRAGAKALWLIVAGIRYRPDLYMGYHLAPGACSALIAARIMGRPSCYQMTGGPVGIIGGGYAAVDSFGGGLGGPSKLIEKLALAVVKRFDLVVVRGGGAQKFLAEKQITSSVAVITGSVNGRIKPPKPDRKFDLVFAGRLSPIKQVHQFVQIVEAVTGAMPQARAVIVGDGPLINELREQAQNLHIADSIEFLGKRKDVEEILADARIFVLTSKSEGLSIALAEAMAAGAVPVVANVGELSDLVVDGVNGCLVEPDRIDLYAERITTLLKDRRLWNEYSPRAVQAARELCDIEVVAERWKKHLGDAVAAASKQTQN